MASVSAVRASLENLKRLLWVAVVQVVILSFPFTGLPARAQAVTWKQVDIGNAVISPGTFTYTAGTPPTYTEKGSGTGYNSLFGDNVGFAQTLAAGNTEIQAQLVSQSSTTTGATAGLMMRESDIQSGSSAVIEVTVGVGVAFRYRQGNYQTQNFVSGPAVTLPVYLKLKRNGNTITGQYSTDNITWNTVGTSTATNVMSPKYYIGFGVTSASSSAFNTAVFKYVSYLTSVPQPSPDLVLWLRDDLGVTTVSGAVSQWSDQSGNGHDATQSTAGLRPTLSAGALNSGVLSGLNFNGTSQYLSMASNFADLTGGVSIFTVLKPTNTTSTGVPLSLGNASNSDAVFTKITNTQASLTANNGATTSTVTTPSSSIGTSYQLLETILQPGATSGTATGTIFVNGVQKATSATMQNLNNITRVSDFIGAGVGPATYFNGGIAEILVYKTALTAAQRAAVESYILSKFAIGTTPTLVPPGFSISTQPLYLPEQTVSLTQAQNGTVYYSLDNSTPVVSESSQWFNNSPISLSKFSVLKAIAGAPFFNNSSLASAMFKVDANTRAVPRNGLVTWLRSDYLQKSGANVTGWTDLSGVGNDATQTTSANQPTLVTNAVNGYPAVVFGTNKFLQLPAGMANFTSGVSIFAVVKPTAVTANARILDFGNGATSNNIQLQEPSTNAAALYLYNGSTASSVNSSSAITLNKFQLLESIADGAGNGSIFTNGLLGAQSASMALLNNITRSNNYIGQGSAGGNYFQGQIAELLVYNRGVTQSEQAGLESYFLQRYQILANQTVAAPRLSLSTSTLTSPAAVAIQAAQGATIFYTQDGTTPSAVSSPVYTKPIQINYTQTVKAIAVLSGAQSAVASATYTLDATQFPAPASTTAPLQLDLQLPLNGIPQDNNQH